MGAMVVVGKEEGGEAPPLRDWLNLPAPVPRFAFR